MRYPHTYPGCESEQFFTSDCANGCGCWMGSCRSGGPDGVDQFGDCPNHPDYDEFYARYPMDHRPVFEQNEKRRAWQRKESEKHIGENI
jgi:hypothetical protein